METPVLNLQSILEVAECLPGLLFVKKAYMKYRPLVKSLLSYRERVISF